MTMNITDTVFLVALIEAFVDVFSFTLVAWGVLYIVWGGFRAARRMFWVEMEPWNARPQQSALLEAARHRFVQRLAFAFDFLIAGFTMQLLTATFIDGLLETTYMYLGIVVLLVLVRVVLGLVTVRELRLSNGLPRTVSVPVSGSSTAKASRKRTTTKRSTKKS